MGHGTYSLPPCTERTIAFFQWVIGIRSLGIQVPPQKVLGHSKPTPNTFSEGTWILRGSMSWCHDLPHELGPRPSPGGPAPRRPRPPDTGPRTARGRYGDPGGSSRSKCAPGDGDGDVRLKGGDGGPVLVLKWLI